MKLLKYAALTTLLVVFVLPAMAQDTLYCEFFTDGSMNLDWFTPWEGGDQMQVDYQPGNPSGDDWVGFIENGMSGGGVGSALSGELSMTDYEIRSQIYCTVNTSTYHAVLARWDTTGGFNQYYYLRTDFDGDQRIQLRKFPGLGGMGETISQWTGAQIPGGVPTQSGWHELALKLEGNQLWAYYDGTLLSGSPFTDSYISHGFFGIYSFNFMSTVATYCDDIVILGEAGPQPFDFSPVSNTMLDENMLPMSIRAMEGQTVYFDLLWNALNGQTTSPAFTITLAIDGDQVFAENNPGVEPNSSDNVISDAWTATLGEHTVTWTLDSGNTVPEGNETNNVLEETILVLDQDAYDFSADSVWITNADTTQYSWIAVGDELYFTLHWSAPVGNGNSGAFTIEMTLDGADFYTETLFGVTQQGNYTTMTTVPYVAESGFHYFTWDVDVDNWVDEFDEGNNFIMEGFEVNLAVNDPWGGELLPTRSKISAVYPNPFNPSVTLQYVNKTPGHLSLKIYDVNGREVVTLIDGYAPQGTSQVSWEANNLASGTYFAVLQAQEGRSVQPLIYIK